MYLLGDIGGTKTRLIWCESEKDLRKQKLKIFITPQKYREFLELLKDFINSSKTQIDANRINTRIVANKKIEKAVFGFAGMLDKKKEKLIYAPNLKDFEGKPLKRDLEKILSSNLPEYKTNKIPKYKPNLLGDHSGNSFGNNLSNNIILENDAVLAGLGEGQYGAGKNFDAFGYITLSTGVGGVKIAKVKISCPNDYRINVPESRPNNKSFKSNLFVNHSDNNSSVNIRVDFNTFGFEPGHSFLLIDNFLFEAEELLGGESIRKILGKKPEEIKDEKFWDYYHQVLSIFLINVSLLWSVDKIILGGSLIKKVSLKRIDFYINKFRPLPLKIQLKKSFLGELAGIYGSLVKLRNK